ncbi:MAG: tRNA uridine-5-carboxymethylaminomethyl(34) synthesis GTPase MnmE [Candidatus Omnitrophota bacterium]
MSIKFDTDDTIAAISTPLGESGIGIVRLSGKDALRIADKIFLSKTKSSLTGAAAFTTHYGFVTEFVKTSSGHKYARKRKIVDEVIVNIMRAPRSYTREDIAEINCHGGIIPLKRTLDLLLKHGARLAQPGEFTQRAVLNGRIDLTQAEAIFNIINAKTLLAQDGAMNQLRGALSRRIKQIKDALVDIIAPLEASIDFPDDEINISQRKRRIRLLMRTAKEVKDLMDTADRGIMLQQGINVILAGSTNVGKSSLMNRLVEFERVIVTPIAGTTRDIVEEVININGLPAKIADTAGIIDTKCLITKQSVNRSLEFLKQADLALFILDGSRKLNRFDLALADKLKDKKVIVVVNKIDLPQKINVSILKKILPAAAKVEISALKGTGVGKLKDKIVKMFFHGDILKNDEILIASLRHKQALNSCQGALSRAISLEKEKGFSECVIFELRCATQCLADMVGEDLSEDILTNIFSRFCIGK